MHIQLWEGASGANLGVMLVAVSRNIDSGRSEGKGDGTQARGWSIGD